MKTSTTTRRMTHLCAQFLLGFLPALATTLDPDFGEGGVASMFVGTTSDSPKEIALQSDGKVVMCGWALNNSSSGSYGYDVGLIRFNPDGSPDATFGVDGRLSTDIGSSYPVFTDDRGNACVVQPDNRIIVAGTTRRYTKGGSASFEWYQWDVMLLRYLADGTLDSGFGTDGKVVIDLRGTGTVPEGFNDVALQSDNKIIGVGYIYPGNNRFLVMRFLSDGTPDTSFGAAGTGVVEEHFSGNVLEDAYQVTVLPDDSLVIVGRGVKPDGNSSLSLLKLTPEGLPDSGFSGDGKLTMNEGPSTEGWGVAADSSGRILVAGFDKASSSSNPRGLVARFNADGSPDTTFSGSGVYISAFADGEELGFRDVAVQADGSILAVGTHGSGATGAIARVQLNEDGTVDGEFGSSGIATTTIDGGSYYYVRSCAIQSDGKALLGVFYYATSGQPYTVLRYIAGSSEARPDGIPMDWIITHFGSNDNAPLEVVKDGRTVSLLDAYLLGQDPFDPNDYLRIQQLTPVGDSLSIGFPTLTGRVYQLESSPDLGSGNWTPVGDPFIGDSNPVTVPLTMDSSHKFFRIVVFLP